MFGYDINSFSLATILILPSLGCHENAFKDDSRASDGWQYLYCTVPMWLSPSRCRGSYSLQETTAVTPAGLISLYYCKIDSLRGYKILYQMCLFTVDKVAHLVRIILITSATTSQTGVNMKNMIVQQESVPCC